jgi:hypothetical protein
MQIPGHQAAIVAGYTTIGLIGEPHPSILVLRDAVDFSQAYTITASNEMKLDLIRLSNTKQWKKQEDSGG